MCTIFFPGDDLYSTAFLFDSIYFFMVFSDFVFPLVSCEKGELLGLNDDHPIFISFSNFIQGNHIRINKVTALENEFVLSENLHWNF